MIPIVIALCLTSMVASAPSDVRPVDQAEARNIETIVKPANRAWGYFNSHPVDAKGFPAPQGQFQQLPMMATPGSRYYPSHLPFYYPSYPQLNYDLGGKYETKSDDTTLEEDEEALRIYFGMFGGGNNNVGAAAAPTTTTTTTTTTTPAPVAVSGSASGSASGTASVGAGATGAKPMANLLETLILINRLAIAKMTMKNILMMIAATG